MKLNIPVRSEWLRMQGRECDADERWDQTRSRSLCSLRAPDLQLSVKHRASPPGQCEAILKSQLACRKTASNTSCVAPFDSRSMNFKKISMRGASSPRHLDPRCSEQAGLDGLHLVSLSCPCPPQLLSTRTDVRTMSSWGTTSLDTDISNAAANAVTSVQWRDLCHVGMQQCVFPSLCAHFFFFFLLHVCYRGGCARGLAVPSSGSLGTVTDSDMFNQIHWHMSTAGLAQLAATGINLTGLLPL